jgi:cyclopropane-fatty-acyl-phospholipid synthase
MIHLLRLFLRHIIRRGNLHLATPSGAVHAGDGTGPPIRVRLLDRRAAFRLLINPHLALGELFMDGRLLLHNGSVYDLLDLLGANLASSKSAGAKLYYYLIECIPTLRKRNTRARARRHVAQHYDIDERLYSLFLDADWQYSCAYFEHANMSLDEAQRAKQRHILAKLLVEPHHKVCDVGSGWGGLAMYMAERTGASVAGITLSPKQLAIANARARVRNLEPQVLFHLSDYRDVGERFDRIVSVGMFEHVGRKSYDRYFSQILHMLTGDGVALLHTIGRATPPSPTNPWVAKYIFPGGYIPSLSEIMPAIERAGLIVTDVEVLRLHYAQTLRAWRERLCARSSDVIALFDERLCRMWEFYLAASECAFHHFGLVVFQIQMAKRIDAVPLTRGYIAQREAALCGREAALASDIPIGPSNGEIDPHPFAKSLQSGSKATRPSEDGPLHA